MKQVDRRPSARLTKPLRAKILEGHPWIYDRAIELPAGIAPGEVVDVVDHEGVVCVAYADPTSPIRARILRGDPLAPVASAIARRASDPTLRTVTGRRLIHGEGDRCPGLVVDAYDDTAVIVFDGVAASAFWTPRLPAILDALPCAHVWLRGERGKRTVGSALRGDPPELIEIHEDSARFLVDVRAGQKTGFFLDQRENRRTIGRHASDAEVLNLYAYTGGFSIHAALGGAARVTSVDIADPAVKATRANFALNGLSLDAHDCVTSDVPAYLAANARRRWDLVICDPPSFVPNEKSRQSGLPMYRRLFEASLAAVRPGGRLAFASCSSHVTEADLIAIAAAAPNVLIRQLAGAGSDHPVIPGFPEGRYLKFLFFDVIDG